MNDLNERIREAIRSEDPDLLEGFDEEPSIFELLFDTMRGRHRWLVLRESRRAPMAQTKPIPGPRSRDCAMP